MFFTSHGMDLKCPFPAPDAKALCEENDAENAINLNEFQNMPVFGMSM